MVHFLLPWLQEQWFLVLFLLKPWLIFVREHGHSERILDVLVEVKLFTTLKHVNSQKGFTWLWSDAQASFSLLFFSFSAPDCWCLFTGIVVHQLWIMIICIQPQTWGASGCGRGCGNGASSFFFLSNWDGAPPGSWCPTQTAYSVYRERRTRDYGLPLMSRVSLGAKQWTFLLQSLNHVRGSAFLRGDGAQPDIMSWRSFW